MDTIVWKYSNLVVHSDLVLLTSLELKFEKGAELDGDTLLYWPGWISQQISDYVNTLECQITWTLLENVVHKMKIEQCRKSIFYGRIVNIFHCVNVHIMSIKNTKSIIPRQQLIFPSSLITYILTSYLLTEYKLDLKTPLWNMLVLHFNVLLPWWTHTGF